MRTVDPLDDKQDYGEHCRASSFPTAD